MLKDIIPYRGQAGVIQLNSIIRSKDTTVFILNYINHSPFTVGSV